MEPQAPVWQTRGAECLTEERVAELVEGRLEGEAFLTAEQHISDCARCIDSYRDAAAND
jgi:hypothetical protein